MFWRADAPAFALRATAWQAGEVEPLRGRLGVTAGEIFPADVGKTRMRVSWRGPWGQCGGEFNAQQSTLNNQRSLGRGAVGQ